MSFDMSKVKEGDKLVTRNGAVVELVYVLDDNLHNYPYTLNTGTSMTKDGSVWDDGTETDYDIIGFADENQHTSDTSEEMQAVELLLSLGYTLKKGV